jgi:hypothetical protein
MDARLPAAAAQNQKSISAWVSCSGTSDDTAGVQKAFAAARNAAFTLVVDCPVRLHSGLAIDRVVFIDDGTTVQFSGAGKFFVDNLFHPAFVIANSSNIALVDWNVEWDGSVPVDPNLGGYEFNGKFVASPGKTQPAGAFNDLVLTGWLAANRRINFVETQGWVKSIWVGGVNPAAVFFITGDSGNVVFSGMRLTVPAAAGAHQFMPQAISSSANWRSNQAVTGKTPETMQYAAIPHHLKFSGIDLDGILMGWQGNLRDTTFENITAHRYGDLQDAGGAHVGGIGKWFPPPHLFYINTHAADPGLSNVNLHFSRITDEGVRVGQARDKGGGDSVSGYANSLKLGCTDCSVDTYTSHRPDGFMDVLPSDGLRISNVTATFDSSFINNVFPAGIRFPAAGYSGVTFENVRMTDTAQATSHGPIGNATNPANTGIVFTNFQIAMHKWVGPDLPLPTITGTNSRVSLAFTMADPATNVAYLEVGSSTLVVTASPAILHPGDEATLTWAAREAAGCSAGGAWSGAVGTSGSRAVKAGAAGNYGYQLDCQTASGPLAATVPVAVQ